MSLPVHRWFRYSAGFSAAWAETVIRDARLETDEVVLDPFAGSGTTLLAAQQCSTRSVGTENHPFVTRVARAKLSWNTNIEQLADAARSLLKQGQSMKHHHVTDSVLLNKCYTPEAISRLVALRLAYANLDHDDAAVRELLWLAVTAILRECSGVGTAQWQYVLPTRSKARVIDPFVAFTARIKMMCSDMALLQSNASTTTADIRLMDSRRMSGLDDIEGRVGLVLTSPPYPNNYDYADATRLEMTFWGEIKGWGDLQGAVRHRLIRSSSQQSAAEQLVLSSLLEDRFVAPIRDDLAEVCGALEAIRETKGGKKTYHTMVAAYFGDLAKTLHALRPLCKTGADLCFVIGDSAPYGIYVPVEVWLERLAVAYGFGVNRFDKLRDRNVKWKNRKHRIPLKEGNLWLKG